MKKILLVTIFSILLAPLYAGPNEKVTKSGFISKKNIHTVKNDFNNDHPKKKIIPCQVYARSRARCST